MTNVELELAESFERVFPVPAVDPDWDDILGRSGERVRNNRSRASWRVAAVAVAVVLMVLLAMPAIGVGGRLLEWFEGGPPRRPALQSPSWSPDGQKVSFVAWHEGRWEVQVVNADGTGQRTLAPAWAPTHLVGPLDAPVWSPDGRRVALVRGDLKSGRHDLFVVNADGSRPVRLARGAGQPAWSPDGRSIAFFGKSPSGISVVRLGAGAASKRLVDGKTVGRAASLAWSPDGTAIAFLTAAGANFDGCFQVHRVDRNGKGPRDLTGAHVPRDPQGLIDATRAPCFGSLSWSPDGQKMAFVRSRTGLDPGSAIYVMNADGTGMRAATDFVETVDNPAWSPDGRKIVFASQLADSPDSETEIFAVNPNGDGRRILTRNDARDADPAWSRDGRKIVFVSDRDGEPALYVMNRDGSGQRRLTRPGS